MINIVLLNLPRSTTGPVLNIIKGKKSLSTRGRDTEVIQVHWTHSIRDISPGWVWNDVGICLEESSAMKTPSRPCWRRVISCCHANLNSTKSPAVSVFFGVVLFFIYILLPGGIHWALLQNGKWWKLISTESIQMSSLYCLLYWQGWCLQLRQRK